MLNIAFEISPLLMASGTFGDKSGVYRYYFGLIKAYGEYLNKNKFKEKIILFSFNRDLIGYPLTKDLSKFLNDETYVIIDKIPNMDSKTNYIVYLFQLFIKPFFRVINKIMPLKNLYTFFINDFYFKRYLKFIKSELKKNKVKIIYHSETSFYPLKQFKNVITIYDLTPIITPYFHREETKDLTQRKLNFTTRHCQGIVCISEATKKDLLIHYPGNKNKKIVVCYPGLDSVFSKFKNNPKLFKDLDVIARHQVPTLRKKRYLLYFGTFEPRKNIINLVESFTQLHLEKKMPSDFKLVLMGGDGWGKVKKGVINFISENFPNREKNNIIVFDFLNDSYLISLIKNAYAFVYPSFYEGFGLPVLESMSLGTPVISSAGSALNEVGGNSVLYVDPYNYYDIKKKMELIFKDKKLVKKLGIQGIKQSKKFNWNNSVSKLYNFFNEL